MPLSSRCLPKTLLALASLTFPNAAAQEPDTANHQEPQTTFVTEDVPPLPSAPDPLSILTEQLEYYRGNFTGNVLNAFDLLIELANCRAADHDEIQVQTLALYAALLLAKEEEEISLSLKDIQRAAALRLPDTQSSRQSVSECLNTQPKATLILNKLLARLATDLQNARGEISGVLEQDLGDTDPTISATANLLMCNLNASQSDKAAKAKDPVEIGHIAGQLSLAVTPKGLANRLETIQTARRDTATYQTSETIQNQPWYQQLSKTSQASLKEAALILAQRGAEFYPLGVVNRAIQGAHEATYVNEGPKILDLLNADLTPEALAAFIVYLDALDARGEPHTLISVSDDGSTVISNLVEMVGIRNTGIEPSAALEAIFRQLINPLSAEQGEAGTCGVTGGILPLMSVLEPAQIIELFFNACAREGGLFVDRQGVVSASDPLNVVIHGRLPMQAILQTELMHRAAELAGGSYNPESDQTTKGPNGLEETVGGLIDQQICDLLFRCLGIKYTPVNVSTDQDAEILRLLREQPGMIPVVLYWPTTRAGENPGDVIVEPSYHVVLPIEVGEGYIKFYNPQGTPNQQQEHGNNIAALPPGTVIDHGPEITYSTNNTQQISKQEFFSYLFGALIPVRNDDNQTARPAHLARQIRLANDSAGRLGNLAP